MAISREFTLNGASNELQLGKKGGKIKFNGTNSDFEIVAEDGVSLMPIRAAQAINQAHLATKSNIDSMVNSVTQSSAKLTDISLAANGTYTIMTLGFDYSETITKIVVKVKTAASTAATVRVYSATGPMDLMSTDLIDTQSTGLYDTYLFYSVSAPGSRSIRMDVVANGSSTGLVDVIVEYDRDLNTTFSHWSTIYETELAAYTEQIFVDANTGSDTTGTGEILTPYATIAKAVTESGATGSAIIVEPGTYLSTTSHGNGIGGGGYTDTNKAIGIFGKPGSSILSSSSTGTRDVTCWYGTNANTKVYGIIFLLLPTSTQNAGVAYQTSYFGHASEPLRGKFYNCAFDSTGKSSMVYSNTGAGGIQIYNCSFDADLTPNANYSGSPGTIRYSTAKAGFSFATDTPIGNLIPNTFDANWHATTNDSTVGVWSGPTYWSDV